MLEKKGYEVAEPSIAKAVLGVEDCLDEIGELDEWRRRVTKNEILAYSHLLFNKSTCLLCDFLVPPVRL